MKGLDDGPDGLDDAAFARALAAPPTSDGRAEVRRLAKALAAAQRASTKAMDRRRALPPGSSRARVTTANANWARAAEHRDRCSDQLEAAIKRAVKRPLVTDENSVLSEVLRELGYTHREHVEGSGARVTCLDGVALYIGSASGTWEWLRRTGQVVPQLRAATPATGGAA